MMCHEVELCCVLVGPVIYHKLCVCVAVPLYIAIKMLPTQQISSNYTSVW